MKVWEMQTTNRNYVSLLSSVWCDALTMSFSLCFGVQMGPILGDMSGSDRPPLSNLGMLVQLIKTSGEAQFNCMPIIK